MDAADWDERYSTAEFVWKTGPNQFLVPEVDGLERGRALDLACGEGRNAVWLAAGGWEATGVDFSAAGLAKGAKLAEAAGVSVNWVRGDVTSWSGDASHDLVIVFYLQVPEDGRRSAMATAARALSPGGTLLVVGHDLLNLGEGVGGPQDPSVLYTPEDIVDDLGHSGVSDLVIERADRVERAVDTDTGPATAIDCMVRAHRGVRS